MPLPPPHIQVEFEKPVDAKGNIEVWLQRLVDGMQDTVKQTIKRAVRNVYEMGLEDFIFGHPAQISLLGIQFQWTADTQLALANAKTDKGVMSKNFKKTEALLRWGDGLHAWAGLGGGITWARNNCGFMPVLPSSQHLFASPHVKQTQQLAQYKWMRFICVYVSGQCCCAC
jgi:hypothetical protein